jgi:hypothetical protein
MSTNTLLDKADRHDWSVCERKFPIRRLRLWALPLLSLLQFVLRPDRALFVLFCSALRGVESRRSLSGSAGIGQLVLCSMLDIAGEGSLVSAYNRYAPALAYQGEEILGCPK